MEKEILERVTYDYYLKAPSYLRYIMDMLPEKLISDEKKYIISRIYNDYLNHAPEEKVRETIKISSMFREKLSVSNMNDIAKFVDYIHSFYLNRIIFETTNRDKFFDNITENVKVFTGCYDLKNIDSMNNNSEYDNMSNYVNRR